MSASTPQEEMGRLISGYWMTQALYVAAKLGIADLLKAGPRSIDDLAAQTQSHPRSLYRLLRGLASIGIFAQNERNQFELTPLAELLRSDVPGSQWAAAVSSGSTFYRAWGEMLYSVKTGGTAFDKVFGSPVFDYLSNHPEEAALFDRTMVSVHGRETAAMLEAYDFSGIRLLADVGGGNGSVLTEALQKYPKLHGMLYDLPNVVERAKPLLAEASLAGRCQAIGGSFFESVPAGADAYLLRHIIHDWDDEKSLIILRNIHRAIGPSGRLLLVESVIPEGNEPSFGKLLDLAMLVIPGGLERTAEEYRRLYDEAGFRLTRIVPTSAEVSFIEGVKK